jgi:hypothetical protein
MDRPNIGRLQEQIANICVGFKLAKALITRQKALAFRESRKVGRGNLNE